MTPRRTSYSKPKPVVDISKPVQTHMDAYIWHHDAKFRVYELDVFTIDDNGKRFAAYYDGTNIGWYDSLHDAKQACYAVARDKGIEL